MLLSQSWIDTAWLSQPTGVIESSAGGARIIAARDPILSIHLTGC